MDGGVQSCLIAGGSIIMMIDLSALDDDVPLDTAHPARIPLHRCHVSHDSSRFSLALDSALLDLDRFLHIVMPSTTRCP